MLLLGGRTNDARLEPPSSTSDDFATASYRKLRLNRNRSWQPPSPDHRLGFWTKIPYCNGNRRLSRAVSALHVKSSLAIASHNEDSAILAARDHQVCKAVRVKVTDSQGIDCEALWIGGLGLKCAIAVTNQYCNQAKAIEIRGEGQIRFTVSI